MLTRPTPLIEPLASFFFTLRNYFYTMQPRSNLLCLDITDTKPKDVCDDTVVYGHAHVGIPVCVRLQRCRKVVCRFSCDSMTREPSPAFSAKSLDLTLGSRIGGLACRGSGCAVPTTDRDVPCPRYPSPRVPILNG